MESQRVSVGGRGRRRQGEVSPSCGGDAGRTFAPCLHRGASLCGLTCLDIKSATSAFERTGPICQAGSILDWMSISSFKVGRFALVALCVCVRVDVCGCDFEHDSPRLP